MTKKGEQKLRTVQRLFASGFDLTEGSIAPFLISPNDDEKPQRGSKIIDRVSDGIVTFEDGSVESASLLKNPYNIPLEGAEYRDGQIFPGQRGANRDLLNKIKAKGAPPVMPMEGARYLRQNASWGVDDYTKDEFFSKWPIDKVVGFLYDRGEEFDDRPAWSKDLDNKKLDEIRSLGDTPEARKALQEYVKPFLPEKNPWD